MIGHPLLSFTSGSTVVVVTPAVTQEVGHGGGRRRRRVIIDDVIYVGTDEQIEAELWRLLQQRKKPAVQAKAPAKKKARPKKVELKALPDRVIPQLIEMPRFEQMLTDSYRHEDAFLQAMLKKMLADYLDEEEVVMLMLS